ncbi:GGDEF domain-containing protein [Magnetofaba australis]|uniref:diguanylate cyclase n=1 Tax=Magnetofaba australis IT-1 TaxID=1434232 RepID=A0A1Y2K9U1_9PROT|nr:GGDEF domain-containing protein [Magnetofaba australis]OSM08446.1 putative diguanylate cyclase [Magnetofaba australis IT-1]
MGIVLDPKMLAQQAKLISEARVRHRSDLASRLQTSRFLSNLDLVQKLTEYRDESQRLSRIYDLHRRLSESLDLAGMLQAFSLWLHPMFAHEMVGYRHAGQKRSHLCCSSHGPHRQTMEEAAHFLLADPQRRTGPGQIDAVGLEYCFVRLDEPIGLERFLIIHPPLMATLPDECSATLLAAIHELRGPLERALAYEDLYDQARLDALTGLVNRRVFEERLRQELANAERYGHPLCLAYLDLDHFKAVNDRLGHAEGDAALLSVSRALTEKVRHSDCLARVGGDEFALILPNTDLRNGRMLMERLCEAVGALGIQAPDAPPLGVSIGVTMWRQGLSLATWREQTDEALYRAKEQGRNRVCI